MNYVPETWRNETLTEAGVDPRSLCNLYAPYTSLDTGTLYAGGNGGYNDPFGQSRDGVDEYEYGRGTWAHMSAVHY